MYCYPKWFKLIEMDIKNCFVRIQLILPLSLFNLESRMPTTINDQ